MLKTELTDPFAIKVFILYLLSNIDEPIDFETVNDIVVQDEFVNYFDFSICFAELVDVQQVIETERTAKNCIRYQSPEEKRYQALKKLSTPT